MDLRQLRQFIAVAETLHFGRAAERLGMTQPPLSQSIMGLERELGATLFERSKRSVALTAFGRQWLEHVRIAVAAVSDLPEIARRLRTGTAGRLTLSFVSTADYSLLPVLVQTYTTAFPNIEIKLVEATSDIQIDALRSKRIDAGILIPTHPAMPVELDYLPLQKEPLIAAIPSTWIDEGRLEIDGEELLGDKWMAERLIMFPAHVSPDFHGLVMEFYRSRGRLPDVRQEAIQMQTIISLVSSGMGMALVPASLRNLGRSGVHYLNLRDGSPLLETGLAWRNGEDHPLVASLVRHVSEAMLGRDGPS